MLKDVTAGLVSEKDAAEIYGVVVGSSALRVDMETTLERRELIRERREESRSVDARFSSTQGPTSKVGCVSEYLDIVEANGMKHIQCRCGHALGPPRETTRNMPTEAIDLWQMRDPW